MATSSSAWKVASFACLRAIAPPRRHDLRIAQLRAEETTDLSVRGLRLADADGRGVSAVQALVAVERDHRLGLALAMDVRHDLERRARLDERDLEELAAQVDAGYDRVDKWERREGRSAE
uniref:Uncharacterized protein n=1 Tax=Hyaloperonospora arabidopsidis (strain Emoy2) TaxID=559515 RepID=M4BND1_HYAAE